MKHLVTLLVTLAALGGLVLPAAADDTATVVRVFELKYRSTEDASAVVQPLLSAQGTVTVQPKQALLTVQDVPGVVDQVAAALEAFDRAPEPYRIRVRLLEARNGPLPDGAKPVKVDNRVQQMFHYKSYRELAAAEVEGKVGSVASAQLGDDYRLTFSSQSFPLRPISLIRVRQRATTPVPVGGERAKATGALSERRAVEMQRLSGGHRLILRDVVLQQRRRGDGKALQKPREVLHGNAFMGLGQKVVLGASKSEDGATALVLILEALPAVER